MRAEAPRATYRLQFNREFRFADALALVPYLEALGISTLYASPIFRARPGSTHGYDVTQPNELNPELGTVEEFTELCSELERRHMGLLLDIVPNHMAVSEDNAWWMDVLRHGPASTNEPIFDIAWSPAVGPLEGRILLAVLGKPYGQALEAREITLGYAPDGPCVRYGSLRLPLDPRTWPSLLGHRLETLEAALSAEPKVFAVYRTLLDQLLALPERGGADPRASAERAHWQEQGPTELWLLVSTHPELAQFLDENLRLFNGKKGDPASFDRLDALLQEQAYRLAFWRTAREKLNYRRFFNINELIGVRVEDSRVFDATHRLVLDLVRDRRVTGLRVDHVDGLRDPLGYLRRLQERVAETTVGGGGGAGPASGPVGGADRGGANGPGSVPGFAAGPVSGGGELYVVVEKILASEETLPEGWPVAGTTGYDFLNKVNGLFVDQAGCRALAAVYARAIGSPAAFADVAHQAKKRVAEELFPGEVLGMQHRLLQLAEMDRYACDLLGEELRQAFVELTACLSLYRTYTHGLGEIEPHDRRALERALREARQRDPTLSEPALNFLGRLLLLELPASLTEEQRRRWLDFVLGWQQMTGPLTAKGIEDTAFYIHNALISLNEVGGDPDHGACSPEALHRFLQQRFERWPTGLNATATHDTKRGEDVRARLNVLSELPGAWEERLARWQRLNAPLRQTVDGEPVPDASVELLLYQSLLGAWPVEPAQEDSFRQRLGDYLIKAGREAKLQTNWVEPNVAYETALLGFVERLLTGGATEFLRDFKSFRDELVYFGAFNSLSQTLIKLTAPGVPDLYRGTELWELTLVDPDNRRPVDFAARARGLEALTRRAADLGDAALAAELAADWTQGSIKQLVIQRGLRLRGAQPELFGRQGSYQPLLPSGERAEHLFAYVRRRGAAWALVAVPRLVSRLLRPGPRLSLAELPWAGTRLLLPGDAPRNWRSALTGEPVQVGQDAAGEGLLVADLFRQLPVALLLGEGGEQGEERRRAEGSLRP